MAHDDTAFMTTRELAELLRISERKVYDLVATQAVPHTKATGKLLFSRGDINRWLASQSSSEPDRNQRPAVFCGSHDPLLDWALRQSRCGMAALFDGSSDGLDRFAKHEGVAAGIHIRNSSGDGWNTETVAARFGAEPCVLVQWATRTRGLITRSGDTSIADFKDLAGRRVMARQAGSGTQTLFDSLVQEHALNAAGIETVGVAGTETEAATAIIEGAADACFGLQSVAQRLGLGFVPACEERFDLLVDRKAWFDPPFQAFWTFCQGNEFTATAATHVGYDITDMGRVHFNGG